MVMAICPGCGLKLESGNLSLDEYYNSPCACRKLFDELSAFTLSLSDKEFIHQLVVDAYSAQHSGINMKPITTVFALVGLYLTFEHGYNGKEVQRAHITLGKTHRQWPRLNPPAEKSALTVLNVLQSLTPENHRERINSWGKSVRLLWISEHENIGKLVKTYLKVRRQAD